MGAITLKGHLFKSGQSAAQEGMLHLADAASPHGVFEQADGTTRPIELVAISHRIGQIDRQINLKNGDTFVTSDNDGADQITSLKAGLFANASRLEAFRPRLIAFVAASCVLVVLAIMYGLPLMAKAAAWATPPKLVQLMDTSTLTTLDTTALSRSGLSTSKREHIEALFQRVVPEDEKHHQFSLKFRDGGKIGPNAFALPFGTIIITDQLAELASDDEITAVLAHEVAHVTENHSLQQLYRTLGFAGLIAVISGDLSGLTEEVLAGGGALIALSASREMELEADKEAVEILQKIDVDPQNLATLLDKIYAKVCEPNNIDCSKSGWFSTHPGSDERRKAIEALSNQSE